MDQAAAEDETARWSSWKICAVCGYRLEHSSNPDVFDGSEWGHFDPDRQDHLVVPVNAAEMMSAINDRCDFCGRDDVEVSTAVLADDFVVGPIRSRGPWAACEECAEIVRRRHWSRLVSHVKKVGAGRTRAASAATLRAAFDTLSVHTHGIIPMEEWRRRAGQSRDPG